MSGATGQGVDALLDAVLAYLPAHTATETSGAAEEDEEQGDWSPLG